MVEKTSLAISREVADKLSQLAIDNGLSTDKLAEIILDAFVSAKGKIYAAPWPEGPGVRVLPDWPKFSVGVFKVRTEDK